MRNIKVTPYFKSHTPLIFQRRRKRSMMVRYLSIMSTITMKRSSRLRLGILCKLNPRTQKASQEAGLPCFQSKSSAAIEVHDLVHRSGTQAVNTNAPSGNAIVNLTIL